MLEQLLVETYNTELAQRYLNEADIFAFDIETDTGEYHWGKKGKRGLSYVADMTHISFYSAGLPAMVLIADWEEVSYEYEMFNIDTEEFELHQGTKLSFNFADEEMQFVKDMFERNGITAIAHNLVFDARQIFGKFNLDFDFKNVLWDTQTIHRFGAWAADYGEDLVADDDDYEAAEEGLGLFNLTAHWLTEAEREWWGSFKGKRKDLTKMIVNDKYRAKAETDDNEINLYVAVDSFMAYKLYEWQHEQIYEHGFEAVNRPEAGIVTDDMVTLLNIDLDCIKLCVEMSAVGTRINREFLHEQLIKHTQLWKASLPNLGLNVESESLFRNKQWQRDYIFAHIQEVTDNTIIVDNRLKTKTGAWSFGKFSMSYYTEEYPELILFRYHFDLETKIRRINELLRHAEYDDRIHTIYGRYTITGRFSSSQPNLQNLQMKRKKKYDKALKAQYKISEPDLDIGYLCASKGKVLVSLDCSNAENWMMAMYARDKDFAWACAQEDFHTTMASTAYFKNQWNDWSDEERSAARNNGKTITFGTSFGMGVKKLARELKTTLGEAKAFLDNKDQTFWRMADAKRTAEKYAKKHGLIILWSGRRVKLRSWDGHVKAYTSWNSMSQGGVGEMIVRGMLQCRELLRHFSACLILGQVHDEIIFEIDPLDYEAGVIDNIIVKLAHIVPDVWNQRTEPTCRWLFTLDNIENSHKWGYNPYVEYPLPLTEYVNEWGTHQYDDMTEAPTWINEYGWGEQALRKEQGLDDDNNSVDQQAALVINNDSVLDWNSVQTALAQAKVIIDQPFTINEQVFVFPHSIHAARAAYHRGLDSTYSTLILSLDALYEVMIKYKEWKDD